MNAIPHTIFRTPSGEELVVLSRADFAALEAALEGAEHRRIVAAVEAGEMRTHSAEDAQAFVEAATPLAFWLGKRAREVGLKRKDVAAAADIAPSYLTGLADGSRKGDPSIILKLARVLRVRMEDLVEG